MNTKVLKGYQAYAPIIQAISQKIPMYPAIMFAQFGIESGYYPTGVWQGNPNASGKNNLAGISLRGILEDFPSLDMFESAYINVMQQTNMITVLHAKSVESQAWALGVSPWSTSHYRDGAGTAPGTLVLQCIKDFSQEMSAAYSGQPITVLSMSQPPTPTYAELLQGQWTSTHPIETWLAKQLYDKGVQS